MGIAATIGTYAVDFYRAGTGAIKKGGKYIASEGKELLVNHTQLGRRVREGVHYAREASKNQFQKLAESSGFSQMIESAKDKAWDAAKTLYRDKEFGTKLEQYAAKRGVLNYTVAGKTKEQILQDWIEMSGVGPTKLAQILSNNPKQMKKISERYPELAKALAATRKNCSFTRTVEEAQKVIDSSFPNQGIKIKRELKAASIGATYLVEKPDGSQAVVKMIKKGVTKESIELEEEITLKVLKELSSSPEEYAKTREMFKTYYRDWKEELNFVSEMNNNKLLADGAKRYSVAKITDISKDGQCIIMDKARGIQMDDLLEILKDYKANPNEFATKYADTIKQYPWLANPEKVMKDLPTTLLKTFDEQFLFMKKGGKSLMHGDPHTGNFFITADANGKLIPEFIDTGNCVARTGSQIKQDISFFSNYLVGNSEGVAKYFLDQCKYTGADKQVKLWELAADIEKNIFGKKQKVTKFADVQGSIMAMLEKHGLSMSAENATAMKAQMQFFQTISETGKLSGQSFNIATLMKDIPTAVWGMIKNGENPYSALKDAIKFAFHNQQRAVGTAYQFTIRDVNKLAAEADNLSVKA